MPNELTTKNKKLMITYYIASALVTLGPMLYYVMKGLITGSEVQKFTMGSMCVVAICLFAVNALAKVSLRCPMWILLMGVYTCLDKIETLLIILCITTILDDFWLGPAAKHYKQRYLMNKEMDRRGVE